MKRLILTVSQKSAEGKVGHAVGKASEALQCRKAEQTDRPSWERVIEARTVPRKGIKEGQVSGATHEGTAAEKTGPNKGCWPFRWK